MAALYERDCWRCRWFSPRSAARMHRRRPSHRPLNRRGRSRSTPCSSPFARTTTRRPRTASARRRSPRRVEGADAIERRLRRLATATAGEEATRRSPRRQPAFASHGLEHDALRVALDREHQCVPIAADEERIFASLAALPDRPDGMRDVSCAQLVAARHLDFAGLRGAERSTLREQLGTGSVVDRTVNAATGTARRSRR